MKSKVSIIVPAYNVENMISACLESVISQTYSNIEIIVVDDGSNDKTGLICDEFENHIPIIKVIHQKNRGVSSARNAALRVASGDFIVFVDADDTVGPRYIEQLVDYSDYDFVTAGYNWQNRDGVWAERLFENLVVTSDELKARPTKYMGKYYFGSPWATLMKRNIIEEHKIRFNEEVKRGEDILFLFTYLEHASNIKMLPLCEYYYHFYSGSLANSIPQDYWKWSICVEEKINSFFEPCNNREIRFLLDRKFDVMRDLLRDYYRYSDKKVLTDIYNNVFFRDMLSYKILNGTFKERLLIICMRHQKYCVYVCFEKLLCFVRRIENKVMRELSRGK